LPDAVVEIGFAEIAAVHRIGAIARIGELAGVGHDQIPAEARRVVAHPRRRVGGTAGEAACTITTWLAVAAWAKCASVMLSTPPLTATASAACRSMA